MVSMKKKLNSILLLFAITLIIFFACTAKQETVQTASVDMLADSGLIAPGAKPELVSRQFVFTEGPAVDRRGNVFFTDQPNDQIWEYSTDGKLSLFMNKAGRSNGMYFDPAGNLITCADEHGQLLSIDSVRKISVLLLNYRGHQFNGPNDLWINANGNIYFTDPYFQRDYWERENPDTALGGERLYFMKDEKSMVVLADSTVIKPNGIVGTPDGKYLYVADMGVDKTYRYEINADGTLFNRTVFINQSSDGMTLDDKGNLYITGSGVTVYDPRGQKIAHINIPEQWTANVCFSGKDKNILFITASEAIYTLPMNVKGVE